MTIGKMIITNPQNNAKMYVYPDKFFTKFKVEHTTGDYLSFVFPEDKTLPSSKFYRAARNAGFTDKCINNMLDYARSAYKLFR